MTPAKESPERLRSYASTLRQPDGVIMLVEDGSVGLDIADALDELANLVEAAPSGGARLESADSDTMLRAISLRLQTWCEAEPGSDQEEGFVEMVCDIREQIDEALPPTPIPQPKVQR